MIMSNSLNWKGDQMTKFLKVRSVSFRETSGSWTPMLLIMYDSYVG